MNLLTRWRQRAAVVGVDIGPDAIRMLQYARAGDSLRVIHYAHAPLSPGMVMEGRIVDLKAVGALIAHARTCSGTCARHAVAALAAPAVRLKRLSVPEGLNEAELETRLELEATRFLPATRSLPHLDFIVLGSDTASPGQIHILLAVANPEAVHRCVVALKMGGMDVIAVDHEAFALARVQTLLTGKTLPPEQMLDVRRDSAVWSDLHVPLAGMLPVETLAPRDSLAWLSACGLALWESVA